MLVGTLGILPKAVWQQLAYCKVPGISNAQEALRSEHEALGPECSHCALTKVDSPGQQDGQEGPVDSAPDVTLPS